MSVEKLPESSTSSCSLTTQKSQFYKGMVIGASMVIIAAMLFYFMTTGRSGNQLAPSNSGQDTNFVCADINPPSGAKSEPNIKYLKCEVK